jgi:hypothetical protein
MLQIFKNKTAVMLTLQAYAAEAQPSQNETTPENPAHHRP